MLLLIMGLTLEIISIPMEDLRRAKKFCINKTGHTVFLQVYSRISKATIPNATVPMLSPVYQTQW
jgi:hypothetical protein